MYDVKISDYLRNKAVMHKLPLISAFELSPVCNFSCKMCYVRKTQSEVNQSGGLLPAHWWIEMAKQGKTYEEILQFFYTGVDLTNLLSL